MRILIIHILVLTFPFALMAQGEYEAEEFVSDGDLKFAVKQMQRSSYIGSAIVCEQSSPDICDSIENIDFELQKGGLALPVGSFTFINHYSKDSTTEMSASNPQINRLIIDSKSGEDVKAVTEGEVTSIFEIPGNEYVVMIKKGAYRVVYGSLGKVHVKIGQWISEGTIIGNVTESNDGKMVFEIWKTVNGISTAEKVEEWIEIN